MPNVIASHPCLDVALHSSHVTMEQSGPCVIVLKPRSNALGVSVEILSVTLAFEPAIITVREMLERCSWCKI